MAYVQVGVTAQRNMATGKFQPAIPLFIEDTAENRESQAKLIEDLGRLFAARMKADAREAAAE